MIAALFVHPRGAYVGLPDVDAWDQQRDARLYAGPHSVVAHPPCARWCQLAHVVEKRYGHKVGDDGGCFASALASVRRWGGVLEHPALSLAWEAHGLRKPEHGRWLHDKGGGWVTQVSQAAYGHPCRKLTWLYCCGFSYQPIDVDWSLPEPTHVISYMRNNGGRDLPRLPKKAASATPPQFRDLLISLAVQP